MRNRAYYVQRRQSLSKSARALYCYDRQQRFSEEALGLPLKPVIGTRKQGPAFSS